MWDTIIRDSYATIIVQLTGVSVACNAGDPTRLNNRTILAGLDRVLTALTSHQQ